PHPHPFPIVSIPILSFSRLSTILSHIHPIPSHPCSHPNAFPIPVRIPSFIPSPPHPTPIPISTPQMEQIKRANRLYTSDTIFLKPTLLIPPPGCPNEAPMGSAPSDPTTTTPTAPTTPSSTPHHDLTASDFLRRLDADIGRSKAAVVEQQLRAGVPKAAVPLPPPGPSLRGPQLGAQPLTRTRRAAALRDTEDEIFTL
ncbi:lysM and putative peptidoglycan-binding domain-containing protein 1-like, partial [Phasianus colchicus]|uniref:lysM and putative peptidoglycan-binding domain-containing protein 1-like n=1 Tax=Phasianus colchicus TaxID=9054 RepID=UPI00129D461D